MCSDHIPKTALITVKICEYMNSLGFSPKEFMITFLSSNHRDIVNRRRLMKAGLGTKGTRSIVNNFGNLTVSCQKGQDDWEAIILEQASAIVNAQEIGRGYFPAGAFTSSNRITPDYFSESAEALRADQVQKGMRFLHSLIRNKLAVAIRSKTDELTKDYDEAHRDEMPNLVDLPVIQPSDAGDTLIEGAVDEATVLSLENLVYVKTTAEDMAAHKLEKIPTMVCSMIAVACNRRHNAIPLANGLMTLAAGVSCRVNEWLHTFGMTTSRTSILQAMDHLRLLQEERMMDLFKINHKIMPLLCFDNIDIHLRIHNTRIDTSSRLFHGTWGFYNVIQSSLQAKCTEEAASIAMFLESMSSADRQPVDIGLFAPTTNDMAHWVLVIKSQMAKALIEYVNHIPGAPERHRLPPLSAKPPPIDPITMHKPNIHFLRMMDAPDSSADGVSRVLDAVMGQIGVDKDKYAEKLLIAGGDVGSNQLLESLRVKRYPPVKALEGIDWVLSIFGGAHTSWNFAKAIWGHHWGDSDKGEDPGVWRSAFALGLDYKKAVATQDFNSIMRAMQIVHKANLVFIIKQVIEATKDFEWNQAGIESVFDKVWYEYFDTTALSAARDSGDHSRYNFIMRLRDFATVVEAHDSTRAGDIGRLMAMWKRWSVMAQGLTGLSHYARHIPRIVMLLEVDLPKSLAQAIKHSLLIPSNERDNHWMAIDEYLEVHIFWLKHMYNNTGHGTDIERLTYRFSNNIPLLRKLMQLLKSLSGHKLIYQPNINSITETSMKAFLSYAEANLAPGLPTRAPKPVANIWREGRRNMAKSINADKAAARSSRFRWGAANVLSSWEDLETPGEE